MATIQSSNMFCMKTTSPMRRYTSTRATINLPQKIQNPGSTSPISLPKLPSRGSFADNKDLNMKSSTGVELIDSNTLFTRHSPNLYSNIDQTTSSVEKMYAIMEAVEDRVEMHKNIGAQRDNWNSLLLNSVNSITLAAATMAGISAAAAAGPAAASGAAIALKLSSTVLYVAATGILAVMNKIQPSQLAEEQRNAVRLFKQLQTQIETKLNNTSPTSLDVNEAMEKVLALDKAYPLPLLGTMLEKFPKKVEPAVWWPRKLRKQQKQQKNIQARNNNNGWSGKLEEEMREVSGVIERNDVAEYLRLSEKALKLNRFLAISGTVLTGAAALGAALSGGGHPVGAVATVFGVVGGALASVVNTLEHGGQVGMVFEMYRSNAGFFRLMEETIESNLQVTDVDRRENGEVFEIKVALQLGRSLSELKQLGASSSRNGPDFKEFASKLF